MLCLFLSLNLLEFCHIYCICILSFSLFITGPIDPRGTLPTGFPTGPGTGGRFVVPSLGGRYPSFCALLKLFSNINNCILFSFFLIVSHWCSVLFNKCICFNLYLLFLSSYSQPASFCKILFPMHFYCIQIQHTPMVFWYIQMYSLHLKLQQNIYVHVSLHSKYVYI